MRSIFLLITLFLLIGCYSLGEPKLISPNTNTIRVGDFQVTLLSVSKDGTEYADNLEDEMDIYWVNLKISNLGNKISKMRINSGTLKDEDLAHYFKYFEPKEIRELYYSNREKLDIDFYKTSKKISLNVENTDNSIPVVYHMLIREDTKKQFVRLDNETMVKWIGRRVIPNTIPTETKLISKHVSNFHGMPLMFHPDLDVWLKPNESYVTHLKFLVHKHAKVKSINSKSDPVYYPLTEGSGIIE